MKFIHLLFLFLPCFALAQTEETQPSVVLQEDPIFKVVEEQPTFPGCENIKDQSKREKCAGYKLRDYLRDNLDYPPLAWENGVEGYVVVSFIIEKDGSISNAEIVRDIGAGCGKEILRLVNSMPTWNPGIQGGQPVRVQFNLVHKFEIN